MDLLPCGRRKDIFNGSGVCTQVPRSLARRSPSLTKHISIRAGSVVLPLQNPLRVAEEWSMIDNLSNGRVAIAAASGWHANDFILSPDTYQNRHADMYEKIAIVQKLWRGEKVSLPNGMGVHTEVSILPSPIQPELPIWLTGSIR